MILLLTILGAGTATQATPPTTTTHSVTIAAQAVTINSQTTTITV